jgi:hypothetical protein
MTDTTGREIKKRGNKEMRKDFMIGRVEFGLFTKKKCILNLSTLFLRKKKFNSLRKYRMIK